MGSALVQRHVAQPSDVANNKGEGLLVGSLPSPAWPHPLLCLPVTPQLPAWLCLGVLKDVRGRIDPGACWA